MITNAEWHEFFNSEPYCTLLDRVTTRLALPLSDDFPEILHTFDNRDINCSGLSLVDLTQTASTCAPMLEQFVRLKLEALKDDDQLGEFPPDEPPDEDDKPVVIEVLPMFRTFLLIYLIEYTLLECGADILPFLRCRRIPHAKQYAALLKSLYAQSRTSA